MSGTEQMEFMLGLVLADVAPTLARRARVTVGFGAQLIAVRAAARGTRRAQTSSEDLPVEIRFSKQAIACCAAGEWDFVMREARRAVADFMLAQRAAPMLRG